jgi:hypothetical protein
MTPVRDASTHCSLQHDCNIQSYNYYPTDKRRNQIHLQNVAQVYQDFRNVMNYTFLKLHIYQLMHKNVC